MTVTPRILVLAGRRAGALDPLARAAGVTHKSLVPVAGEAMLGRVLRIVETALPDAPVFVSVEDFASLSAEPTIARLSASGRITAVEARPHIVDSVAAASGASGYPLIITTADNVLMTPESLRALTEAGAAGGADVIVVMAERKDILAAHPDGQRRFYRFRDGAFSNCNMFWLGSPKALRAAESFRLGGQFAKHKRRAVKALGLTTLLLYALRLPTLAGMFRHFSRRFGVRIAPMLLREGRVAIDVDNERTLRVAEEILSRETTV